MYYSLVFNLLAYQTTNGRCIVAYKTRQVLTRRCAEWPINYVYNAFVVEKYLEE